MITLYQPRLTHFLGKKARSPENADVFFYLSFEDALWELVKAEKLLQGSLFLMPSFYCAEVAENIEKKGFRCAYYELDADFRCDTRAVAEAIKKLKPNVVILYHPLGMTSTLKADQTWVLSLAPDTLLIEDCAHLLLAPEELTFLHPKHYFIDSLRKMTPLQGSRLFAARGSAPISRNSGAVFSFYRYSLILTYWAWRFFLSLALLFKSRTLYFWSERWFESYNDRIGIGKAPYRGFWLSGFLSRFLDVSKIRATKEKLATLYEKEVKTLCAEHPDFYPVQIPASEFKNLKFFPLGVKENSKKLADFLNRSNLFLESIFTDSPHARTHHYLMLPMNPALKEKDIVRLFTALKKYK